MLTCDGRSNESEKAPVFTQKHAEDNEAYTKEFAAKLANLLEDSKTPYFLSVGQPSALDGHVVVFIARMNDIGRSDLLPAKLKSYGEKAFAGQAWRDLMQGMSTNPLGGD